MEEDCFKNKKIYGFPINLTYVDKEKVWEEVKNTDLHRILMRDVDFICAVSCCPYPNYIMSVWVFLAVLVDNVD